MLPSKIILAVLAHGISTVLAHVVMVEPHPFNLDTAPLLQSWPLSDQYPFPCQGNTQHAEKVTTVTAGQTQTVRFWGSAVHGGGSCQFSVAYGDTPPQDPEEWKNIYTILGGCPAEAEGNIPTTEKDFNDRENGRQCGNDVDKECTRQFEIPIPKEMKNGPATFAWTWFNKHGNREMYMNCAPIIVTGGVEDGTFVDSLPPIFRANYPGVCTTGPSGTVLGFPDPGEYGVVYQNPDAHAQGTCPAANVPDFERKDAPLVSQPSQPANSTYVAPVSSVAPTVPTSQVPPHANSTSQVPPYANSTSTANNVGETMKPSGFVTSACVPAATVPHKDAATETPISDGRPWWAAGWAPCPNTKEGGFFCIDSDTFGICTLGWGNPQGVAAGTKCENDMIV